MGSERRGERFEVMCLRNICGIRRVDRGINAMIREGCELSVLERIERNVFKLVREYGRNGR